MLSFRQISTESHRERKYSVVVLCGFFGPHIYIIYFVGKQGILISKKIKLTKEETYKVSQREGKQEME